MCFLGKLFYLYIHILTLLFNYTQMKLTNLYPTGSKRLVVLSERRPSPHLFEITVLLADSVCLTLQDLQTSETN